MIENKRFKHSITLQGEDEIWDSQADVYFRVCGALKRLNELNDELGKLTILYSSKCKTEETLIKEGERLEEENKELKESIERVLFLIEKKQKFSKENIDKQMVYDNLTFMEYYYKGMFDACEELKNELKGDEGNDRG